MSQTYGEPNQSSPPATPRWVKVFGLVIIVLILLFAILHLTGNNFSDHGSHLPTIEHGVQPP